MQGNPDISNQLLKYLKNDKLFVDKEKFNYVLQSHPQYPQLISITDTLDQFRFDYNLYEATLDEIKEFTGSFIASFVSANNQLAYSYVEHDHTKYKINSVSVSEDVVKKYWAGNVLVLSDNKKLKSRRNQKNLAYVLGIILSVIVLLLGTNFNGHIFGFYLLSISGLLISIITLKDVFGINSALSNKICRVSMKTDCDTILNSKKWKIFELLDFSDLSFTFFTSQLIALLCSSIFNITSHFFLSQFYILLLCFPFILVSLIYQKFGERKWCMLCLGIISVLTLEFLFVFFLERDVNDGLQFPYRFTIFYGILCISIYNIWRLFKKLNLRKKELLEINIKRNRTLLSYPVFKSILRRNKPYIIDSDFLNINNLPQHQNIMLVTDPFCDHCKRLHFELETLSRQFEGGLDWNIVFNIKVNDEPDLDKLIYRNMMFLQLSNPSFFKTALHSWYEDENEEKWLHKYSNAVDFDAIDSILDQQHQWCTEERINFTPALLINGYLLPSIYSIKDLYFVIPYLMDDVEWK